MSSYDFLSIYFPADSELDATRKLDMRAAASLLIRSVYADVDTSPNSPFGDLFVSPAAPMMAGMEEAGNRLLSDMDPENVGAGTVFNCDWTRQFLLNFGVQDDSTQRSYGLIRLYFSDNTEREIDRSTEFQIGDGVYRPFVPHAGALALLPRGEEGAAETNYRNYSFFDTDNYVVDLLVFGVAGQLASAGAGVAVDRTIEGLTAATALSDFSGGTSPTQLQELARRVRYNFHSRTPVTRGGATNMVHQQFPEITLTGCTISGDFEQVRDVANPGQVAAGRIDLMMRSAELLEDVVTVRLRQMEGVDGQVYSGWLDLPETPIQLLSFTNSGETFEPIVYSVSTDPLKPGLSAAYGAAERLLISIPYALDSAGAPLITPGLDDDGVYADFVVTYLFDPTLKICQEFTLGDDNVPAGLDLYVRWFVPLEVQELSVSFNRKAGTTFNLAAARSEILTAYNSHRYETPASPALIDAALYYAGAHSVNEILLEAVVRYSVAQYVWLGDLLVEPEDADTWVDFADSCAAVPETPVLSAYEPEFEYLDISDHTYAVSGERNITYILKSSALKLTERRSV